MKICVLGLWHLGAVTAACLAEAGFVTVGTDADREVVAKLKEGTPPLYEPGLAELTAAGLRSHRLTFTDDAAAAVADSDIVWVAYDTPVDEEDRADVKFVQTAIQAVFPYLKDRSVVLVSSQMPVGSIAELERSFAAVAGGRRVDFGCSPENLRLGRAIDAFRSADRIVVGVRNNAARATLEPVLSRFCPRLIWISVESAEMTKHAINAYLATSVTFINEIATLCEQAGADASEVELALRSEPRIGQKAYIRPGGAFAGGTLARDVVFLGALGERCSLNLPLLDSIIPSNRGHGLWALRRIEERLAPLAGRTIAVLGLAYKPGTDTIRRSSSVELIQALLARGATVRAFDPKVGRLPPEFGSVTLASSAAEAAAGADCLVVATEWPEFKALGIADLVHGGRAPLIIDQNRFLDPAIAADPRIEVMTLGKPS